MRGSSNKEMENEGGEEISKRRKWSKNEYRYENKSHLKSHSS